MQFFSLFEVKLGTQYMQQRVKNAENDEETGQPTKEWDGCKKWRKGTAKQRERWLQTKGKRGQPTIGKLAAKIEEKRAAKIEESGLKSKRKEGRKKVKQWGRKEKQERWKWCRKRGNRRRKRRSNGGSYNQRKSFKFWFYVWRIRKSPF